LLPPSLSNPDPNHEFFLLEILKYLDITEEESPWSEDATENSRLGDAAHQWYMNAV
jgi:hypothetical protein